MATSIAPEQATPQDGSLESASTAIAGLLSEKKTEDKHPREAPPEQPTGETAPTAQQAPAAPSSEESEQARSDEKEEVTEQPPQPRKIKVNDEIGEVTEDELLKGYLRHADYTRKTQAVAEEKRKFESEEAAAVRTQRQHYDQLLGQLETALTELQPLEEPNWEKRKTEVTAEQLNAELLQWQASQKRIEQVRAERKRVKDQQDADAARGFQQYVELEEAKLLDALPDMKEPEKAKVLRGKLIEHAKAYGFTPEELGRVVDHRVVLLLHDAMQFKTTTAKKPEIRNKIEKAIEASEPGSRTTAQKPDKLREANERLRKSHSVEDGAAAIAALLDREAAPTRR